MSKRPVITLVPRIKRRRGRVPDQWIEFGTRDLNISKFHNNILSLKTKSGSRKWNNVSMSEQMKAVIQKLLDTKTLDSKLIAEMHPDEEMELSAILKDAGIIDKLGLHGQIQVRKIKEIVEELEALEGEIEFGNDNPAIKKRIRQILLLLVHLKKIPRSEADWKISCL